MRKRLLAALLCAAMVFSVSACGGNGDDTESESENVKVDPPTVTSLATFDDIKSILVDDYEITDEIIENGFSNLLFGAGGGLVEVTDRDVVQAGDIVLTGFAGAPNDELAATLTEDELKEMKSNMSTTEGYEQLIDVSNNGSIDESTGELAGSYISGDWGKFSDGLIGAKVGEEKSHEVTFPNPYASDTRLSGQNATFTFTVEKIYVKVTLDTITDEEIKEYLEEDYEITNKEEAIAYVRKALSYSAIIDYVLSESEVNIPENYLDWRADEYIEYTNDLYTTVYGISFETFLSTYYGQTLEEAKADVMEWMKESVIPYEVIYSEYVTSKDLELDEDGLQEMIDELLTEYKAYYSSADDIYMEYGCGNVEAGKAYILNKTAFDEYFESLYDASIAVTE